jgi:large conductance mechanosensitive channel
VKRLFEDFKAFIDKGDVVMVAIGLVMALYFKAIVDKVIEGVITPVLAALVGESDIESIGFHLGDAFVKVGLVAGAVIDFLVVSAVLFVVVKAYGSWRSPVADEAPPAGPSEVELLTEIRDSLRSR